ncbi:cobalamin biosynthesis protein [Phaeospirillum tilakii]|uniref:Cobalamin biosynthesis protein n=1 Tax=Phaeospirillum tilakii TaxID=741673 RepID=A0ABW5CDS6_9PROT
MPARAWLGIGCRPGLAPATLDAALAAFAARHRLDLATLAGLATLEARAGEPALVALAGRLGLPLRAFSAARLEQETPRLATPSARVFALTGCHGVAEAAALAAAGPAAILRIPRAAFAAVTLAVAE